MKALKVIGVIVAVVAAMVLLKAAFVSKTVTLVADTGYRGVVKVVVDPNTDETTSFLGNRIWNVEDGTVRVHDTAALDPSTRFRLVYRSGDMIAQAGPGAGKQAPGHPFLFTSFKPGIYRFFVGTAAEAHAAGFNE